MAMSSSSDGDGGRPTLNPAPSLIGTMKQYFTRYRAVKNKGTSHAYTHDALQCSWCAFIRHWNASRREGRPFASWLEAREERRGEHSMTDLRESICCMAEREWRLCYVHLVEGCENCAATCDRPTRDQWENQTSGAGSIVTSARARSWSKRAYTVDVSALEAVIVMIVAAETAATLRRSFVAAAVVIEGGLRLGHASAVAREDAVLQRVIVRLRQRECGLILAHNIRDILQQATTWLPRILRWRISQSADAIVLLRGTRVASLRLRRRITIARTFRATPADVMVYDSLGNPALIASCVNQRGWTIATPPVSSVSSATSTHQLLARSDPAASVPRVTIEQYRIMIAEAEQVRNDALDAQNLAESARTRASAAEAVAEESQRDRLALVERLRRLERAAFGAPQAEQSAHERQGLGLSWRQRRRHGGSDYKPARGTEDGSRGQQQEDTV
ncbi:hypothetical protein PHYSODRAFT_338199 [Phytophthora sojae]|uniref:Uncharacterized protein n=1 Tax=Phytophthora sojae (strain P6497) TaxID=1094619 RepID=G5A3K9_PHYSP|nr:hypothetical protein PHYSODRAFT_338199 [Phytophthora sojae]EGZ09382.1 hypothetical protein PHYSODRAFT_338199 [Phytophthora sojae]|eukprot:XP_009534243.1 hypothetical protein PHYSODRAFT_338199 [Phytophthora sojae]